MPGVEHRQHKGLNNRAENSQQPTRRRELQMKPSNFSTMRSPSGKRKYNQTVWPMISAGNRYPV